MLHFQAKQLGESMSMQAPEISMPILCVCGFLLTIRFFICHMSYIQLKMGDNAGVLNGKGAKPKS